MPATLNLDKVNEVKTMLRSLLISNGNREVTLGQLNGLYKEIEGNNIPFREFNYSNLFEFLSTIPDAVVLQHNRDGELIVKHVNTAKSMHISSLVDRQKKPPRKSKSAHRPRYNYSYIKPVQQHYNPSSLNALRQVLQEINNLPAQLKSRGISKSEVLFKIRERLGKFALYTDKHLSAHLNELQHFICVEENYIYFKNELDERTVNHQPFNSTIPVKNSFVSGNSNGLKVELKNDSFQKPVSKSKDVHDTSNKIEQNCCTENTKNANGIAERNCGTKKLQNCNNIFEENFSSKITQNSQETEQNSSVKERRNSRNVEKNSSIQDQCNSQCIDTNSVCDLIKERTKIRLQKLIQNHPEGIWCSELPSVYKKEYEIDLEYIELGFNNITEFVAALPNIFKIVEPPNTNRQMVLDVRKFSCSNIQQTTTMASLYNFDDYIATDPEPIPTRLSSGVSRSLIPEGVMNLNETVEQISVSFLLSEDYIEVLVSEIFTPSFFWITLRENKKKRKTMMSELDEFYRNRNIDEYKIPQVILEPGLNIACVYARVWHRGMIKKIKPDGFVVIFFYDYGTVKTYNPNDLYFLNKKFSTLPAQAIACGLYNLKPIGSNEWPRESVTKFIRKVWDLPLIAMIGDANEESNSMMISLTDTSDDLNDLHIADWMVENKFAEWGKMVCIKNNFITQSLQNKGCYSISSDASSTSPQYSVSYESKIAALEKYRAKYNSSSECSSVDETVYVYNDTIEDEKPSIYQKLFNRYKQLTVTSVKTIKSDVHENKQSSSEILQLDYNDSLKNLPNLITPTNLETTNEDKENSIENNGLTVCHSNPNALSELNDFHRVCYGGHGRMKPIDWSLAVRDNSSSSDRSSLFNRLKNLKI